MSAVSDLSVGMCYAVNVPRVSAGHTCTFPKLQIQSLSRVQFRPYDISGVNHTRRCSAHKELFMNYVTHISFFKSPPPCNVLDAPVQRLVTMWPTLSNPFDVT